MIVSPTSLGGLSAHANTADYMDNISSIAYVSSAADRGDNSLVKINATTFALAYAGAGDDGFITTFSVDPNTGAISTIGTLEHETGDNAHNSMVYVDVGGVNCANNYLGCQDHFVLAYQGTGGDGFISTINYTENHPTAVGYSGGMTAVKAESTNDTGYEYAVDDSIWASLVQIDADSFALASTGASGDGFIDTFMVNASGTILTSMVDEWEFDAADATEMSLVKVDADTFAVAYKGVGGDGFISSFNANGTGKINTSLNSVLEHDTADGQDNSFIQLDSDTYVLAYTGTGGDGFISTIGINSTGKVSAGVDLEHDTVSASGNALVKVDSDTVLLAYAGTFTDSGEATGVIKSFTIPADGTSITEVTKNGSVLSMVSTTHSIVQGSQDSTYILAGNEAAAAGKVVNLQIKDISVATTPAANLGCYDCIKPQLMAAEIESSSGTEIVTNSDESVDIYGVVGEELTITVKITDNSPIDGIKFSGIYTNFQDKPSSMNLYYSNNFDSSSYGSYLDDISTSFYEYNSRVADVAFDQLGSIIWSPVEVSISEVPSTAENVNYKNKHGVVEVLTLAYTLTLNGPVNPSEIWVEARDSAGNELNIKLPVTLTVEGDAPLNFDGGEQKLLAFFDKSFLSAMVSNWNNSDGTVEEFSTFLGIPDEKLPSWTTSLATWVADEKIDVADMIVAVEHVINQ
jgi:hypothetical protein